METRYQNILVGVDGSDQSEKAFIEAVWLAKEHCSQLFIVYIDSEVVPYQDEKDEVARLRKQISKPVLGKVERAQSFGVEQVEVIVESGNPKKLLAKSLPKERQIDAIVIGTSRSGKASKGLIGSTVAYVVNRAPCTVLVVK